MFVLLKHPSGLLMQLTEYCMLSHLAFCSKIQTLVFCSVHTSMWLQWQLLIFLCSLKVFFPEESPQCTQLFISAGFMPKPYLIISTFFLHLLRKTHLNTRPQQASKLFWSLALVPSLQFANPCLTAWICSSWSALCHCWWYSPCSPFFTCPVERCICRARLALWCAVKR